MDETDTVLDNWLCPCGRRPASLLELSWAFRSKEELGHHHGRPVCYGCELKCEICAEESREGRPLFHRRRNVFQFLKVSLSASTKKALVDQVLAQVIGKTTGYLPRSNLQIAVRHLAKGEKHHRSRGVSAGAAGRVALPGVARLASTLGSFARPGPPPPPRR